MIEEKIKRIKEETGARILCGIMPLVSRRNALFMKNEIAGVPVTEELIERYPTLTKCTQEIWDAKSMLVNCYENGGKLLTVSEWGNGRKSDFSDYHVQSRGGFGSINYKVAKYGDVAAIKVVYDDDDVILISEQGIIIRIAAESIRECARPSKGVKLMRLSENDSVITLTLAKNNGEETNKPEDADINENDDENSAEVTENISVDTQEN